MYIYSNASSKLQCIPLQNGTDWVKYLLISIALLVFSIFIILPLAVIFTEALSKGLKVYLIAISDPDTISAIYLTLIVTAIVVPLNIIFGIAAAWSISKFNIKYKNVITTLIDIPLSVSPVIVGLCYILVFGIHGWIGSWILDHGFKIIFALPSIIISTIFVTLPFVAKSLIPLMQEQGNDEEEAALILGASGFQTFWHITLPNIKWALFHSVLLSSARSMGEFGAVSVVSGHIRGETNTMTLHIEILYNEYHFTAAFATASVLTILALATQAVKIYIKSNEQNRFKN